MSDGGLLGPCGLDVLRWAGSFWDWRKRELRGRFRELHIVGVQRIRRVERCFELGAWRGRGRLELGILELRCWFERLGWCELGVVFFGLGLVGESARHELELIVLGLGVVGRSVRVELRFIVLELELRRRDRRG